MRGEKPQKSDRLGVASRERIARMAGVEMKSESIKMFSHLLCGSAMLSSHQM